jgi:pimeloyl-ACP methyl ester carboxylesterase
MLDRVQAPALGMFGDKDIIVNPLQWRPMLVGIKDVRIERFPTSGHFPMLEEPTDFSQRLKAFLDEPVSRQSTSQTLSTSIML